MAFGQINNGDTGLSVRNLLNAALAFLTAKEDIINGIKGYAINVLALEAIPVSGQTIYFGHTPQAPSTTAGTAKVYIRKAGTIKAADIFCYAAVTAGSAESWSAYISKNGSADTLIKTVGAATNERNFQNTALEIPVAVGDYIEIKLVNPTWAITPATIIFGGHIYIE